MSIRDTILAIDDSTTELVDVPEWGVKVAVKSLTLAEQQQFMQSVRQRTGQPQAEYRIDRDKFGPQLLIRTCHDPETDAPVFEAADAQRISQLSAKAVQRVLTVATRLAGLGGDEQVDEVMGNLKEMADDE